MSIQLDTPSPCRDQLTFAEASLEGIEAWVNALPMVHIGATVKQLYQGILELNELKVSPITRFKMLELLRPSTYHILNVLGRSYLQHTSTSIQHQVQIADLAQALQYELAMGFKLVLVSTLHNRSKLPKNTFNQLLSQSIHRSITEMGQTILRSCQLYTPTPEDIWKELYLLFRYAQKFGLLKLSVQDSEKYFKVKTTIEDAFKQILLLACTKPNQLKPSELDQMYKSLELWTSLVKLAPGEHAATLFILDINKNDPPIYRQYLKSPINKQHLGVYTEKLVISLHKNMTPVSSQQQIELPIVIPDNLSASLLKHLIVAWRKPSPRSHDRTPSKGEASICLGFNSIHFYLAGKTELNILLGDQDRSSTPSSSKTTKAIKHSINHANLINSSSGGYCLKSFDQDELALEAGQLIGIQEEKEKWKVGVIRWIKNSDDHFECQMGVQSLATQAIACGIKAIKKVGTEESFTHSFFLPELAALAIKANIITPPNTFHEGLKVEVNINGKQKQFRLNTLLESQQEYYRFEASPIGVDF